MKNIMVIDDDINIGNLIQEALEDEGYGISRAYSGTEAVLYLRQNEKPDLILLDLMLPGLNGEEILPQLSGTPVIVVSAKATIDDKVGLLMGGAADYLTKPFEIKELLARIAVQLRKKPYGADSSKVVYNDITLDTATRQVSVCDTRVRLTKTEYAILKLLMLNPAQVITRTSILERISDDTPDCVESSLKVHICNLRRKLKEVSGKDYIEAVWGIGFKLKSFTVS